MNINTYTSPIYLKDEVDDLISLKYSNNTEIREILEEFAIDLQLIHNFTRKLVDFNNGKADNDRLKAAFNHYKSAKSVNLFGDIVE